MDKIVQFNYKKQKQKIIQSKTDGIFDLKAFQNNFQKSPKQLSLKTQRKRHSFSEYYNRICQNKSSLSQYPSLKKQIKPHQSQKMSNKIAEMIKAKLQQSRNKNSIQQESKKSIDEQKQKKISHSAYINARKKVFEKQATLSLGISCQINNNQNINKYQKDIILDVKMQQKQLIIGQQQKNNNKQIKYQDDLSLQTHYKHPKKLQYLQRIVTKNIKRHLGQINKIQITTDLQPQQISKQLKTTFIKRGFLTVFKRKAKQTSLMIHSKNDFKFKSQNKQKQDYSSKLKNINQINQQQFQFYPKKQKIKIQNTYQYNQIIQINSKSFNIFWIKQNEIKNIFNFNQNSKQQIASITKIMTCFLTLLIAQFFCLNIKKQKIIVSQKASKMPGTSAKLSYSDTCTVYDMLHALMLPSGNDAAIALGQWGGKVIRKYSSLLKKLKNIESTNLQTQKSTSILSSYIVKKKSNIKLFIYHMNKLGKTLNLSHTHFSNTHGLMNQKAYSTSYDISILAYYAMKNKIFKQIVNKKYFKCQLFNRTYSHNKEVFWQNTNKLLSVSGFQGVKTGITPSAGPCLVSLFEISPQQYFIITILKTKSCQMRFKQTINILKYTFQNTKLWSKQDDNYKKYIVQLQKYNRLDIKDQQTEFLNDFKQNTQSHSESGQEASLKSYQ